MNDRADAHAGAADEPARRNGTGGHAEGNDNGSVLWGFTLTTFLSALLLFSVQPMFAKMVLPVLGGSPSVWAVAMLFFQGALLAGYCYAHLLMRHLPPATTGLVHVAFTGLAVLSAMPAWMPRGFVEPPAGEPYLWQLGLFTVAIGLPFMAVSANAPLLQAWFASTGHRQGRDPYFLYAASNLGSMLALLSYPVLLEPAFGVRALSSIWTVGFALLLVCLALCYLAVRNAAGTTNTSAAAPAATASREPDVAAPTLAQRLGWVGLALVPSALLTAFTTHITTDIASAPLLWVMPLTLYLLTFVLVFRDRPILFLPLLAIIAPACWIAGNWLTGALSWHDAPQGAKLTIAGVLLAAFVATYVRGGLGASRWLLIVHLVSVVLALLQLSQSRHDTWFVTSATGFAVFFTSALVAHRTLYEARPAARHLTEFYLWMSLGGVLGGLFAALVAPKLFSEVFEYPLLLALSMACRPGAQSLFEALGAGAVSGLRAVGAKLPANWKGLEKDQGDELLRLWLMLAAGLLAIFWVPWITLRYSEEMPLLGQVLRWGLPVVLVGIAALAYRQWPGQQLLGALRQADARLAPYLTGALLCVLLWLMARYFNVYAWGSTTLLAVLMAIALLALWRWPARQLVAALLMFLTVVMLPSAVRKGDAKRSYFGVYRVLLSNDGEFNILMHGTTLHGAQRVRDEKGEPVADTTPGTYYHPKSPMAQSVGVVREAAAARGGKPRIGVIGLGTGSLACLSEEGDSWRFFEIDPVMIGIATESRSFTYMANCQPKADIVIGDARLTLAKEKAGSFDLIIVDAFTSDAVPVHLMTKEALEIYRDKISESGVTVLHISNRYLDLERVLAATIKEVPGLEGVVVSDDEADGSYASTTSTVVAVAKSKAALEAFRKMDGFRELTGAGRQRAWTDDYSDILGPFMSKLGRRD